MLLLFDFAYSQEYRDLEVLLPGCYVDFDDTTSEEYEKLLENNYWAVYEQKSYLTNNFKIRRYIKDSVVRPRFFIKGFGLNRTFSISGKWIDRQLFPGDRLMFSIRNAESPRDSKSYYMYAKGDLVETKDKKFPFFDELNNYELRVVSNNINESIAKLDLKSFSSGGFEGGIFIYWMGDINSDDELDLLVGISTHYAGTALYFYLSDPSSNKLFKKIPVGSCSSC